MAKELSHNQGSSPPNRLRRGKEKRDHTGRGIEPPLENLIVIGASAGGHKALWEVVKEISHDIPASVILMQHLAPKQASGLQSFRLDTWLRDASRVPVVQIQSGARLRASVVYTTPAGMAVSLRGRTLHLVRQDLKAPFSTINILFHSAASEFQDRVIGVILTGLLKDGTTGLKAVHDAGGVTIVQDPSEAEFPDMPASAMKDLPVTFCLKLADIGPTLDLLARRKTKLETGLAVSVRTLKERVALLVRLIAQSKRNPDTHHFLSAEMIALELDLRSIQTLLDHTLAEEARRRSTARREG
ncbi:MAG TPA: chemotaxis protein CheB [Nitrospira sp.]|nr:chemotaxis protein CheB [Nitrospira sp.]